MQEPFDLLILGSGSTAFAAALAAHELGKTAVMTEERTVACVNRGGQSIPGHATGHFYRPPVAVVGMTEQEAIAAGHPCWCNTLPRSRVPRAGAMRDTRGIIKMVADAKTDEILGVAMVGHSASEVIHEAAMVLRFHATLQDFIDLVHVYPTMVEDLTIAAISRFKDPRTLSCCAE